MLNLKKLLNYKKVVCFGHLKNKSKHSRGYMEKCLKRK